MPSSVPLTEFAGSTGFGIWVLTHGLFLVVVLPNMNSPDLFYNLISMHVIVSSLIIVPSSRTGSWIWTILPGVPPLDSYLNDASIVCFKA